MHGRLDFQPISTSAEVAPPAPDLRQMVDFLLRRWKVITLTALTVMALTLIVVVALTPRYTATAQILLEPRKERIFGADSILPDLDLDSGSIDSHISVLTSTNLLARVVEKQNLTRDEEFVDTDSPGLLGAARSWLLPAEVSPAAQESSGIPEPTLRAIAALRDRLDVKRVARQYVLAVSVTSVDPLKAARLANAVADAFVVDRLEARYEAAKRASNWLTERMAGLREQLRHSEEDVAKFREENKLTTTTSEGKVTVSEQQLSELNAKLVAARAETAERKAKFEQADKVRAAGGNLQAIPDVVRSQVISDLRKQEAEVTRKEADASARYSDQHPTVINARAERRDIERSIGAEVARIIANLKNDYDVSLARERSLQTSLDLLTGQGAGGNTPVAIRLRELERINAANKTLYEDFLSRAKITREQSAFEESEARVISPAVKANAPTFPKKSLFMALALLLGLALGTAGAWALEMLSSGFATAREVEDRLGRPVLASVPLLLPAERRIEGKVLDPLGYSLKKPLSRYTEAVRALRVGVQMADVDQPPKVVLITSSVPKEGKSTLAACLAYSAAKAGQRVVLVDADLRRPATTATFGLEGQPGVVDVLTGAAALENAIAGGQISILPAGMKSQNPADLLASVRMQHVVQRLREAYDLVLIDTSPVAPVVDARLLMRLADKAVFVVRWQTTPREVAESCLAQLSADRKVAGIAFNLVNEKKARQYSGYAAYTAEDYAGYYQ